MEKIVRLIFQIKTRSSVKHFVLFQSGKTKLWVTCKTYAELLLFLLQNHIEGYHELSSKTQIYFSTAVAKYDADFYIKVDDDVHVNLG